MRAPDSGSASRGPRLTVLLPAGRRSPLSLLGALLFHLGLLVLFLGTRALSLATWEAARAPGERSGVRGGGGGGGGGIRVIALPSLGPATVAAEPPRREAPLPEEPARPTVPEPTPVPEPAPISPPTARDSTPSTTSGTGVGTDTAGGAAGSGGGRGGGRGTGTGTGTGPGQGPGSGGDGGRAMPPEPRQVILPPLDYPRELRGRTFSVTFWVSERGRVERVAVEPELPDRGFARKFTDVMRNYRFRPARDSLGTNIAGTTTIGVTF